MDLGLLQALVRALFQALLRSRPTGHCNVPIVVSSVDVTNVFSTVLSRVFQAFAERFFNDFPINRFANKFKQIIQLRMVFCIIAIVHQDAALRIGGNTDCVKRRAKSLPKE